MKQPIVWQEIHTGGGCKAYGADFPEGSITMTEECLIVIKDFMTFTDFWLEYADEVAEEKNSRGIVHMDNITVCDFYDFIYRMELNAHFGEIANKYIKIRSPK